MRQLDAIPGVRGDSPPSSYRTWTITLDTPPPRDEEIVQKDAIRLTASRRFVVPGPLADLPGLRCSSQLSPPDSLGEREPVRRDLNYR